VSEFVRGMMGHLRTEQLQSLMHLLGEAQRESD
jgi:hypothetical protein